MSKVLEEMKKRQIVMEDGRYMIFYTFAPKDNLGPSILAVPVPEATPDEPAEEN
jgi:hypothetical protein